MKRHRMSECRIESKDTKTNKGNAEIKRGDITEGRKLSRKNRKNVFENEKNK